LRQARDVRLRGDETGRIALFVRFRREADMDRCAASPASVVNDPSLPSAADFAVMHNVTFLPTTM
jgi:hypothetical protein